MMSAPMTPGTHAQRVRRNTIRTDPHPLSMTASGGKMIHNITRQKDIFLFYHSVQPQGSHQVDSKGDKRV